MDNNNNPGGDKQPKMPKFNMNWLYTVIILLLAILFFTDGGTSFLGGVTPDQEATYTKFKTYVDKGYAEKVVVNKDKSTLRMYVRQKNIRDVFGKTAQQVGAHPCVSVTYGSPDALDTYLANALKDRKIVDYSYEMDSNSGLMTLFYTFGPILFFVVLWIFMMRRMGGGGGGGGVFNVGKSKAQMYEKGNDLGITFKDVAGQAGAKQEVQEIVDFLKEPQKYTDLGGKIPKGALLVGPPGTGKTLLAKAVAGEAGVPFFSMSGSDFVEMFVGVGASRVRDLFRQAKAKSPCIIFIDEIDAVGRQRGAGLGGGHDEREQTLNQLLVEMDGFEANDAVILIAATNRPDILDPALLRPGRFDRQVYVGLPDVKGREEILRVHTKNKPLGPDVSLKTIARSTAGFSGADLENLVNEAALLAARQGKKAITEKEIEEASVKVMMGPEKKSHVVTDEERRLTAYHETGHAITGYFSKHHDPVHQISIISRGGAGGYTMYLPEKDPSYVTKTAMFENIVTLLGGRVAEQLVLEDISTGASSDLQRATDTARAMVTRYGFSERMGPVVYGSDPGETFLGRDFGQGKGYSEAIASEIDNEIRDIVDEAYETARRTLTEHMNELHKVAGVLMEREKISGEEFKTLMEGGTLPPYDLGRGETAQPVAPAPDSAAPVQPAEQPETQQPAEPANPQPDTQE